MKDYIATFETSAQITENSFTVLNPSLKIDENTTIGDINKWFSKKSRGNVMQVCIIELENIED